jgi:spore coat polysaccharide biosynthesis predicted glycosyltransferase SpsG
MNQITSLSVSGPTYGIGHTVRQRSLLETARSEGWQTSEIIINELEPLVEQLIKNWKYFKNSNCLVIDLDPRFAKSNFFELDKFFNNNDFKLICKVLIDSKPNFPIKNTLNQVHFNLTICPYGTSESRVKADEISGFVYSIFPKSLERIRNNKSLSLSGKLNVVISCGGSDPANISLLYLRILKSFSVAKLHIQIVIGKFFSQNQIKNILEIVHELPHNVEVLYSPLSLEQAFEFADVSLVTGGLTRNESMFAGVCTIVTDINEEQSKYTKWFSESDAVIALGILDPLENTWVEYHAMNSITAILSNRERQHVLANNAKKCFPSNGASRVLSEIRIVCSI